MNQKPLNQENLIKLAIGDLVSMQPSIKAPNEPICVFYPWESQVHTPVKIPPNTLGVIVGQSEGIIDILSEERYLIMIDDTIYDSHVQYLFRISDSCPVI